jgi:hypothetical protein
MSERLRIVAINENVPTFSPRQEGQRAVSLIKAASNAEERAAVAQAYLRRVRKYQQMRREEAAKSR